jgi:hypothetical protein
MNRNVEAGSLAVSDKYSLASEVGRNSLEHLKEGEESPDQMNRMLKAFEIMRAELEARRTQ